MECRMRRRVLGSLAATIIASPAISYPSVEGIHQSGFVPIGGIDQWIAITGTDSRNPIILFLHGGPGSAASPFAQAEFEGWDKDFTVVQWDQRGAGMTFARNGKSVAASMTVERMTQDGIEVAEYLCKRLRKRRIILLARISHTPVDCAAG